MPLSNQQLVDHDGAAKLHQAIYDSYFLRRKTRTIRRQCQNLLRQGRSNLARKDGFSADALPLIVCIWSPRRACGWREKGITLDIYNMKHLWRYFPGTQNLGITIGGMAPNEFTAKIFLHIKRYSDAPLANNLDTRRSTAGHVVILAGGAVLWQLKKRLSSHPAPRRLNLLIRLQMVY